VRPALPYFRLTVRLAVLVTPFSVALMVALPWEDRRRRDPGSEPRGVKSARTGCQDRDGGRSGLDRRATVEP